MAVLAGTRRAAEALARDLQRDGFSATALDGPCDDAAPGTVAVLEGHLSAGADYPFARLAVFTGRRPGQQPAKKAKAKNKGLSSLTDIQPCLLYTSFFAQIYCIDFIRKWNANQNKSDILNPIWILCKKIAQKSTGEGSWKKSWVPRRRIIVRISCMVGWKHTF